MSAEPAKINGHAILERFASPTPDQSRRTSLCCARLPGKGTGWCLREEGHEGEHAGIASERDPANPLLQNTKGLRKK